MSTIATVSNVSDGLGEQNLTEKSDKIADEQRSDVQGGLIVVVWALKAEHAISNLHFVHVLR